MAGVRWQWDDEEAPEDYGRLVGMFGRSEAKVPRLVECGGWRNRRESGSLAMDLQHGTAPDLGPRIWAVGEETTTESRVATRRGPRLQVQTFSGHGKVECARILATTRTVPWLRVVGNGDSP